MESGSTIESVIIYRFLIGCLCVFANYRIAEALTIDDGPLGIFARWRSWLSWKAATAPQYGLLWSLHDLSTCPYCIGVWISLAIAVVLKYRWQLDIWESLLWLAAIAGGQTFLESLSPEDEDKENAQ